VSSTSLEEIQQLQFVDLERANERLRDFLNQLLPFRVVTSTIRPLAVSLNSINGFIVTDTGKRLFFKTHVESQSIINEYYNSKILAEAGYPLIVPLHSFTELGKQVLIYEVIDSPSLFDVVRSAEKGPRHQDGARLVAIQEAADRKLWELYQATLQQSSPEEHAASPVHQLFFHRLTGGRFTSFYEGQDLVLPQGIIPFDRLAQLTWVINGVRYQDNLRTLVERAIMLLNPSRARTPSIIGHGDAHNGNVFVDQARGTLTYFDPAFAGRHSPFLDLTKPLFHNVFAVWMYHPEEVAATLSIRQDLRGDTLFVEHDFAPSAIRAAFFRSKIREVLRPLLRELATRGWLPAEWQSYLKAALLCCPLLTMNLRDRDKFPPAIALLGLTLSVVMGSRAADSPPVGLVDMELDQLAKELRLP
jgi:hypothetical protein